MHPPYSDGKHREAHTYDDDVLVVYFIRERNRRIRMVGVFRSFEYTAFITAFR